VASSSARSYHHGNLRKAVLNLAHEVLEAEGREALSLRDLARRLGVSHAAPAHHFVDRDGLLDALAARALSDLAALASSLPGGASSSGPDPGAFLVGFFRAFARYGAEQPRLVRLMIDRKDGDALKDLTAATFSGPVAWLDAARRAGAVVDPVGVRAEEILEVVLLGLLDVAARTGTSRRLDRVAGTTAEIVLAGLDGRAGHSDVAGPRRGRGAGRGGGGPVS